MHRTAILLGDSIIDNAPYVGLNGRDVTSHLKEFATDWAIERRAVDGAVCNDIGSKQLGVPIPKKSPLILSVGGNDALMNISTLSDSNPMTFGSAMVQLREIREEFRLSYRNVLDMLLDFNVPVIVLTIYNPRFGLESYSKELQFAAEGALSAFNDVILQEVNQKNFDVLDIRNICVLDEDYANPIEPSDIGGRKIARKIAEWLASKDRYGDVSSVF